MALILFVDDEALTLSLLSQAAHMIGHEAVIANSGREALQIASEKTPDLIMLDLNLTDLDGLATLKELRSQAGTADIPAVVLTADAGLDLEQRVTQAGARAFLSKPIRLQTLLEVIGEYAGQA